MKTQIRIATSMLFVVFSLALASVPAVADNILFSNGGVNGNGGAFPISGGSIVSESINLNSSRSNVYDIQLGVWMLPGDSLLSLDWSFTSLENGGTVYASGTATGQDLSSTFLFTNTFGYDVYQITASGLNVGLDAGTYWLNIDGQDSGGSDVYWDENSGPSLASENSLGTIPSESFSLLGSTGGQTTPEPSTLMLFGSGVVGLTALVRKRRAG